MSALPNFITSQHYIDGLLYPKFVPAEQLKKIKSYPIRPDDIFVTCCPKSGTHWIMKIVFLALNKAEDKYIQHTPQLNKDYYWFEASAFPVPGFPDEKLIHNPPPGPRLIWSHLQYNKMAGGPPNTTPAKYIYCARNPKDVMVSFYHHYYSRRGLEMEFDLTWDEFVEHFLRGDISYGSWWDHVPEWWAHRDDPNVLFLKYEDLKKDLSSNVKTIADFLGCSLDQETIEKIAKATTIDSMKVNSAFWTKGHFLRKGIVGDWKNHLTPAQSEAIDALYHKAVEGTGLKMEFD